MGGETTDRGGVAGGGRRLASPVAAGSTITTTQCYLNVAPFATKVSV